MGLKNISIAVKLVAVGALLIIVPLGIVTILSVSKSERGLSESAGTQLSTRAAEIAMLIDKVYEEELKMAVSLSIDDDIVAAARAAANKQETVAEPPRGKARSGATSQEQLAATASEKLTRFKKTTGLGESYQVLAVFGADGVCVAASDPTYLGVKVSEREYFKEAMAGKVNAGAATLNKVTNMPSTPFAAPVKSGNSIVGIVLDVADIAFLNDLVTGEKVGKTGYATVVDNTGICIAHPNKDYIFKLDMKTLKGMEGITKSVMAGESGVKSYVFNGQHKTAGFAPVKTTGWSVLLTEDNQEFLAVANDVRNSILIVGAISLVCAVLIFILFSLTITRPLKKGVAFAELVSSGDFSSQLPIEQRDEIGKLAAALNAMSVKLRGMVITIQDSAEQVASSSEEITASAQKLAEGAQSQASTLEETSASVEELTASVDQVSEHAQSQAAAVEEGSSSMTQVHKSIEEVSKNLSEIAILAGKSVDNAMEGAKAVTEVVDGINLIASSSEKIGGIVNVIADIADQTNLLSLNASIEAARAGEHGRGFAVVADEVSKLADRSSASTKEIEQLIKESVKNVSKGVETARGSQMAMEQIRAASQKVKEMIAGLSESMTQQVDAVKELAKALENVSEMSQSISAATEEQTTNAKQVSKAVENVNEVTQSTASAAEEMSSATEQLASMAQELQKMTSQFRIGEETERAARGSTLPAVAASSEPARETA